MGAYPPAERDALIVMYVPLVRTIAGRLAKRLPSSVDTDELISVGTVGLIEAIDRFDPQRGVPFKAYAEVRIRGSMVDHLRSSDFVPRAVRRKFARIEYTRKHLAAKFGRPPSREEMAAELEMSPDDFDDYETQSEIRKQVSGNAPLGDEDGPTIIDQVESDLTLVEDDLVQREIIEELRSAITFLPEKERVVLTFYYLQGMGLKEIGRTLGVTESRACQIAKAALARLRVRLKLAE